MALVAGSLSQMEQTLPLFLYGEQDNDVHITQTEEMYTALRRGNVKAGLERTLDWFDQYLKQ